MPDYDFRAIESKWRARWEESKLFRAPEPPKRKYYVLEMFAYPSGDIHMGHFRNYSIGDVAARYRRMAGYDVLHPFGWDAFGLPAEQAAIQRSIHPRTWTLQNIETGKKTLQRMGISYDWEREVRTCEPDYYRWTQWLFLLLYQRGLAYQGSSTVNWCETCKTILANEQAQDGACWRCRGTVERRELANCWFFKYTDYADRLLRDIDRLEGWPEGVKQMQRNWIGRSDGAEVDFKLDSGETLTVFTTRPDTLWGVTFAVIAPEHLLAARMEAPEVKEYIRKAGQKSERERTMEGEKDGVFTGRHAINPVNGGRVPLWVADYVLAGYGTGVVMGVPAHDTRDFAFAKKYGLPIKVVIEPGAAGAEPGLPSILMPTGVEAAPEPLDPATMEEAWVDAGVMVDSGEMTGMPSPAGIPRVIEHLAAKGVGRSKTHYRLKDWLISRQRYWGCPIPIIHCPACGAQAVPEKDLPVILPPDQMDFMPRGRSPLEDNEAFMKAACPKCGGPARRDADTMDTFMCSSYYLFRYADARNGREPWAKEKAAAWLPVDLYIGGIEHACMHLLYFRFITKVLHDAGRLSTDEPVTRLYNHGMVYDARGELMSKSKDNVVSPSAIMDDWGVDVCRLAMFFFAPSDAEIRWSENGLIGAKRFVLRFWNRVQALGEATRGAEGPFDLGALSPPVRAAWRKLHQVIRHTTGAMERDLHFNTAIAAMMELLNVLDETPVPATDADRRALRGTAKAMVQIIAPMAPFLGEALWEALGHPDSVFRSAWPAFDAEAARESEIEIPVQINGKLRGRITVPADAAEDLVRARALDAIQPHLAGKPPRKIIVVPGKLVNIVA